MCQFASFFHNPHTGEIVVSDLTSHGNTEQTLKLNLNIWREGHYLPNGEIVLRTTSDDRIDLVEYKNAFVSRFPTFVSFLNWSLPIITKDGVYESDLDLRGLTSAKDLVLPKTVGGGLDLSGLTSAKDLVLPKTVGGGLDLRDTVRTELNDKKVKL